ncbi:MAG: helix-turn-helix domain-containing protein [Candidatus Humimicrobiaceae bacterium]
MKYIELGKLIKSERERRGWEQADLAAMVSRGQQAVSRWEKGNSRPQQDDLFKLVDLFSGDVEEWLTKAGYQIEEPDLSLAPFLPLNNLSAENFELFSRDLVQALSPTADVHRYGSQGHKQEGIDLYAKHPDNSVQDYQCKRHKQFGPTDIAVAVKVTTLKAKHHHLLLARRATPIARKAMDKHQWWSLWDIEDISAKVRRLPPDDATRIIDTYFPGWRKRFLGIEEPSPWLSSKEFYLPLENRLKLFSHGWTFVGREKELEILKEFEDQKESQSILLVGRGGIGKSRLLRAWSTALPKPIKVAFVSQGSDILPKDYELLPKGPSYLVVDDAHDRADMLAILSTISRRRPEMKVILSTRPYGVARLQDELTQAGVTYDHDKSVTLNDLTLEEAKSLSEEILYTVNGDTKYAQRIAEITKDCPLATVIGSQLVGKGQIQPEILNNDEEFRKHLMRSFRNVVAGQIGGSNAEAIHDLLNFISMVQPINSSDPKFQEAAEKLLERKFDKVVRDIGTLEEAGVLLRRGHRLRVVPDLLADYVRADASYDEKDKKPTGYADRVFNAAQNDLATNLLVNISQLDWRLSANGVQPMLLEEVWSNLKEQFKKAKIYERAAILLALEKISYYQPKQVLDFVRLALEEPTDEIEESHKAFMFTETSYCNVTEKIPPILRYVAYYQDYLYEALDLLKTLAETDERSTNPYPAHPLRVLQDIASIEPGKPYGYNEAIADHVIAWLQQESTSKFSPFDVLDVLLQTEGHQSEIKGFTITMRAFKVRPQAVANLRKRVVDAAFNIVTTKPLKDALRAIKSIGAALSYPHGLLGQNITDSDSATWEPGILDILKRLEDVVKNTQIDPFIAVEVRSAVSWHSSYSKTAIKIAAKRVLAAIPMTIPYEVSRAVVDSWGRTFEKEDDQVGRNEEALIKWRKALATKLINEYKNNFSGLIKMLEQRVSTMNDALMSRHPDAGHFLAALMEYSPEFAEFLGKSLLSRTKSPLSPWFNAVITVTAKKNKGVAIEFVKEAIKKKDKTLIQCAARALGWGLYDLPISDEEVDVVKELALSDDLWVRQTIVRAVKRFSTEQKAAALNILLSIDFAHSKEIADEVLGEFEEKHGEFKIADLSKEQLEQLLARLVPCLSIDDYHIGLFLSKLSFINPEATLKLMMDRVEYKETNPKLENYDPLPYSWSRSGPLRFHETSQYEQLLRTVRDWSTVKTGNWIRFHYSSDLFKLVSAGFDEVTLKVLEEWIMSANERQLEAAAALLSEANRTFVWEKQQFVIKILEQAQKFGNTCYKKVSSPLHASVLQGVKSGTPGQPFPEDIEQCDRSHELMQKLPIGSPAYNFYKALFEEAKAEIARHTIDDFEFE